MAIHQSKAQKETVERVMHEFKHGDLKTSHGRRVKNPRQAIAIGLHEAGASKYESKEKNRQNLNVPKLASGVVRPGRTAARTGAGVNLPARSSTKKRSGEILPGARR